MHILSDTTFIKGFIIIIVCFSLIALTDAQSCICMQYMGNHCGDRIREGLLRGYCEKNYLYHCSAAYFPAQTNKLCKSCQHSTKPGIDFCENGGEGNYAIDENRKYIFYIMKNILFNYNL